MISKGTCQFSKYSPVSLHYGSDGKPDGILVQTLDMRFGFSLHDAEQMNWDDAMRKYGAEGMLTKQQWLIVAAYEEQINRLLEQVGGDLLREDKNYWSSSVKCYSGNAWTYNGGNGTLYSGYSKYNSFTVRPTLAF